MNAMSQAIGHDPRIVKAQSAHAAMSPEYVTQTVNFPWYLHIARRHKHNLLCHHRRCRNLYIISLVRRNLNYTLQAVPKQHTSYTTLGVKVVHRVVELRYEPTQK